MCFDSVTTPLTVYPKEVISTYVCWQDIRNEIKYKLCHQNKSGSPVIKLV